MATTTGDEGVVVVFWGFVALFVMLTWQSMVRKASHIDPWPTELAMPLPMHKWPKAEKLQLERVGEGELPYPEDLAPTSKSGSALFAACSDGWIKQVSLSSGIVVNWTKIPSNGRPLGLALGLHGEVLACEPSLVCFLLLYFIHSFIASLRQVFTYGL